MDLANLRKLRLLFEDPQARRTTLCFLLKDRRTLPDKDNLGAVLMNMLAVKPVDRMRAQDLLAMPYLSDVIDVDADAWMAHIAPERRQIAASNQWILEDEVGAYLEDKDGLCRPELKSLMPLIKVWLCGIAIATASADLLGSAWRMFLRVLYNDVFQSREIDQPWYTALACLLLYQTYWDNDMADVLIHVVNQDDQHFLHMRRDANELRALARMVFAAENYVLEGVCACAPLADDDCLHTPMDEDE